MGPGELNRQKLELVSLLHDLGKLRVPDRCLEFARGTGSTAEGGPLRQD